MTDAIEHEMQPIPARDDVAQLVITTADLPESATMLVDYEIDGVACKSVGHPYQGVPVPAGAVVTNVELG